MRSPAGGSSRFMASSATAICVSVPAVIVRGKLATKRGAIAGLVAFLVD